MFRRSLFGIFIKKIILFTFEKFDLFSFFFFLVRLWFNIFISRRIIFNRHNSSDFFFNPVHPLLTFKIFFIAFSTRFIPYHEAGNSLLVARPQLEVATIVIVSLSPYLHLCCVASLLTEVMCTRKTETVVVTSNFLPLVTGKNGKIFLRVDNIGIILPILLLSCKYKFQQW